MVKAVLYVTDNPELFEKRRQKMKKLDNDNIIVLSLKLGLICLVLTVILAYLNSVTAPMIEAAKETETHKALESMIEGAAFIPLNENVYKAEKDGKIVGYVVNVTSEKGYGGDIDMLVSFTADFKISGIKFPGAFSETPGIGSKVKNTAFTDRFTNRSDTKIVSRKPENDSEVEAITGATISSNAVNDGVLKAKEILKETHK